MCLVGSTPTNRMIGTRAPACRTVRSAVRCGKLAEDKTWGSPVDVVSTKASYTNSSSVHRVRLEEYMRTMGTTGYWIQPITSSHMFAARNGYCSGQTAATALWCSRFTWKMGWMLRLSAALMKIVKEQLAPERWVAQLLCVEPIPQAARWIRVATVAFVQVKITYVALGRGQKYAFTL